MHVPGRLRKGEEEGKKAPGGQDVRADELKTRAFMPTFQEQITHPAPAQAAGSGCRKR